MASTARQVQCSQDVADFRFTTYNTGSSTVVTVVVTVKLVTQHCGSNVTPTAQYTFTHFCYEKEREREIKEPSAPSVLCPFPLFSSRHHSFAPRSSSTSINTKTNHKHTKSHNQKVISSIFQSADKQSIY
jgi:hypothetical protein